jgi:hypothetical protein
MGTQYGGGAQRPSNWVWRRQITGVYKVRNDALKPMPLDKEVSAKASSIHDINGKQA